MSVITWFKQDRTIRNLSTIAMSILFFATFIVFLTAHFKVAGIMFIVFCIIGGIKKIYE